MITGSIVIYKNSTEMIIRVISSTLKSNINHLYIIDNSPIDLTTRIIPNDDRLIYIFTGANIGYGAGHNIAIKKSIAIGATYHLIINPDIYFEKNVIFELVKYMDLNQNIGLIMPKITYPNGQIQYLCKLIPTPFDLIFRRFLPKSYFPKDKDRFQLKFTNYDKIMDVPYLSGCFMLLRIKVLKEVGLFDERFFMYPEDIDLTRRIHEKYRTVYFPEVSIIHDHARESYKSFRMLLIHIKNIIIYFNKWGWLFDSKRKTINAKILRDLKYGC